MLDVKVFGFIQSLLLHSNSTDKETRERERGRGREREREIERVVKFC